MTMRLHTSRPGGSHTNHGENNAQKQHYGRWKNTCENVSLSAGERTQISRLNPAQQRQLASKARAPPRFFGKCHGEYKGWKPLKLGSFHVHTVRRTIESKPFRSCRGTLSLASGHQSIRAASSSGVRCWRLQACSGARWRATPLLAVRSQRRCDLYGSDWNNLD